MESFITLHGVLDTNGLTGEVHIKECIINTDSIDFVCPPLPGQDEHVKSIVYMGARSLGVTEEKWQIEFLLKGTPIT